MKIVAHIERLHNSFTLGFGHFYCREGGKIDASDGHNYCYEGLEEADLPKFFLPEDVNKIKSLKHGEQIAVELGFRVMADESFRKDVKSKQVLNATLLED